MKTFSVYIMSNSRHTVLYTGVTDDLQRRVSEHKSMEKPGFTKRYRTTLLVYFEQTLDPKAAITREKEIKGWLRRKKIALISGSNPTWRDLGVQTES